MIIVREGLPGGGKTLSAVGEDVLRAFDESRTVVTNIWLDTLAINRLLRKDVNDLLVFLDPEERLENGEPVPFSEVKDFENYDTRVDRQQRGPLYVIDECHEAFSTKSKEWKLGGDLLVQWFAKHRHKACDVTLITQDRMSIPVEIRRRAEFFYRYKKLAMVGLKGAYLRSTYHKDSERALRTDMGRYPRQWFGLYKSTLDRVREKLPPVKNIFLTWRMLTIWGSAAVLLFWAFGQGVHLPSGAKARTQGASMAAAKAAAASDPQKTVRPVTVQERELANRIEAAKLQAKADLLEDGRFPVEGDAGGLLPGKGGGGGGLQYVELPPRKPRFTLDGYRLWIEGYLFVNAQAIYFIGGRRDEEEKHFKALDLAQYGFEVTPISNCLAFIKSEDWGTYRLTCDAPVKIGGPDYVVKGEKVNAPVKP